jgi:hypothetical protein
MLELWLAPIGPDFSVDRAARKFALALLSGLGANRSESFRFRRERLEEFLDTLSLGF